MASRELYRRFTNLCQQWPKDETKIGRDYGEYFRAQLGKHFPHGDLGQVENPKAIEVELSALERLVNNAHFNENPLKRSSASGLEAWVCRESISNEGIKQIQEDDENSLIRRLKTKMSAKFLFSKSAYKLDQEFKALDGKKEDKDDKKL